MLPTIVNINMGFTIYYMSGGIGVEALGWDESGRVFKKKAPREGKIHLASELFDGWMMGLEPTTLRTTI
jgi:hypothetical protein